jgi:hypothetical protein
MFSGKKTSGKGCYSLIIQKYSLAVKYYYAFRIGSQNGQFNFPNQGAD